MTNSYNDMQNAKAIMFIGSNAAEAHPVSMLHILHAKETGSKIIVCDPRFTRTAAKADQFVRLRSGSDIPLIYGMLYHIFKNGWEDKAYLAARVYGIDKVKEEVMKWTPDKVTEACGVPEDQVLLAAEMIAEDQPARSSGAWDRRSTRLATQSSPPAFSSSSLETLAFPAAAPISSVATITCRARPTWDRIPTPCPAITASRRARGRTGRMSGTSIWTGSRSALHPMR